MTILCVAGRRAGGPVTITRSPGFNARMTLLALVATLHGPSPSDPSLGHCPHFDAGEPDRHGGTDRDDLSFDSDGCAIVEPLSRDLTRRSSKLLPQVLFEGPIELVSSDPKAALVRIAPVDGGLTKTEDELPHARLAPSRLDEVECRVPEAMEQARVRAAAGSGKPAHLRDRVGANRVAKGHQIARIPVTAFVLRQTFHDPARCCCARDDVECEQVRHFVCDEPVPLIGGLVHREEDAVAGRVGR